MSVNRKEMLMRYEYDCGWLEYSSAIYNFYKGIPRDRYLNPTYVNYDLLTYLIFGSDLILRSPRSFFYRKSIIDEIGTIPECLGLDEETVVKAANEFDRFYKIKMESILRVRAACYEIGSKRMEEISGIGNWIKYMAERGVEPFKRAGRMTVKDFVRSTVWRDILFTTEALLHASQRKETGIYLIDQWYEELPKIDVVAFNTIFSSMYIFSIMIPRVHEVVIEELTKLLKVLFNFDDERVKSVLRCYWTMKKENDEQQPVQEST